MSHPVHRTTTDGQFELPRPPHKARPTARTPRPNRRARRRPCVRPATLSKNGPPGLTASHSNFARPQRDLNGALLKWAKLARLLSIDLRENWTINSRDHTHLYAIKGDCFSKLRLCVRVSIRPSRTPITGPSPRCAGFTVAFTNAPKKTGTAGENCHPATGQHHRQVLDDRHRPAG